MMAKRSRPCCCSDLRCESGRGERGLRQAFDCGCQG
jgi:hypothetical protein